MNTREPELPDGHVVVLGQPWDNGIFHIPADQPSFGWHENHTLIIGDPAGHIDPDLFSSEKIRIGFAQHGPLILFIMKGPGIPDGMLESPRPWLPDSPIPEITTIDTGGHILWTVIVVSRGVVSAMRAFTTSPQVTQFLRRAFAEQRAYGQLTYEQADQWIMDWQATAPDERSAWRRVIVSCLAGD